MGMRTRKQFRGLSENSPFTLAGIMLPLWASLLFAGNTSGLTARVAIGEPTQNSGSVSFSLTNASDSRRCVLVADTGNGFGIEPFLKVILVGSSSPANQATAVNSSTERSVSLVPLDPGENLAAEFTLRSRFGDIPPDTYTLIARYVPSIDLVERFSVDAEKLGCLLTAERVSAAHARLSFVAEDALAYEATKIRQWQNGADSERWEALRWLSNNALKQGIPESEVIRILGEPRSIRASGQWVYNVNAVGILVGFDKGVVSDVTAFE